MKYHLKKEKRRKKNKVGKRKRVGQEKKESRFFFDRYLKLSQIPRN